MGTERLLRWEPPVVADLAELAAAMEPVVAAVQQLVERMIAALRAVWESLQRAVEQMREVWLRFFVVMRRVDLGLRWSAWLGRNGRGCNKLHPYVVRAVWWVAMRLPAWVILRAPLAPLRTRTPLPP